MASERTHILNVKAILSDIFAEMNGMFITEDRICKSYKAKTGKTLEDDFRLLGMNLQEFMERYFHETFSVYSDPTQRSYVRRLNHSSHASSSRPATSKPTDLNNQIPAEFFSSLIASSSQNRQSSLPPVISQNRQSSLPPVISQNRQSSLPPVISRDSPPGFSPLKQQDIVDQRTDELEKQFDDFGLEDNQFDQQPEEAVSNVEEELDNSDEYFETIEMPQETIKGESTEQPVQSKGDENFPFLYEDFPMFNVKNVRFGSTRVVEISRESAYSEESTEQHASTKRDDDFPPLNEKAEATKRNIPPPPGFEEVESTQTKTQKTRIKYEVPVELRFEDCQFWVVQQVLFYNILQGSLTNTVDVNRYRDEYQKYVDKTTDVYEPVNDKFTWLTGEHLSVNPNAEGYFPNNSFVIDVLQLYSKKYPNGMSSRDLILLEETLCSNDQPVCLGRSTEIMSVAEMIERKMIVFEKNRFCVHDYIKSINLLKLPPGITSNLYRVLNAQHDATVQEISTYSGILNDLNGNPVLVQNEDIIRQANIFPLVFSVSAQANELQNVRIASIQIHKKLPRWKVLLDQPNANCGEVNIHCDCHQCFKGQAAIIVPTQD